MKSWLDSRKGLERGMMLAAALLVGCGTGLEEEAAAQTASEALGAASDSIHLAELEGLLAGVEVNPLPGRHEASRCDPEPEVTEVQVCGKTFPSRLRFEWSDCALRRPPPPPGSGPRMGDGQQRPPPPEGLEPPRSSGVVELSHDVQASPEGTCGEETRMDVRDSASFSLTHLMPDGKVMSVQGTSSSTASHALSETSFTRSGTLDTRRELRDAEGNVLRGVHLSGTLAVTFDRSSEQPGRTMNGTFDATFADGTTSVITLTGLRRAPPHVCRWPLGGSVRQTLTDGTEHVLNFGAECGTATLDGQPFELRRGPHPGGPRPDGGAPHAGPR